MRAEPEPVELRDAARLRGRAQDVGTRRGLGIAVSEGKLLDRAALRAHPLPAVTNGDKDSKGRLLVIAGSRDVPGATLLTATAAMRAGAGKLKIATVDSAAVAIGVTMPEAMVVGLDEAA